MKISDVFRKRAFFGVAVFCITAIATIGALSTGGNGDEPSPDALVDLNEPDTSGNQLAEGTKPGLPELGSQVAEQPKDTEKAPDNAGTEVADKADNAEKTDTPQVAVVPEKTEEKPQQTADAGNEVEVQDNRNEETGEAAQTANSEDASKPEQVEVLSPQLIAEQLSFDRNAGLLWPVEGEVVIPYSPDHGVYHYTLDQFGTSDAMVLSSVVGTEVKAAAKGVVTDISEDVRTGTTVTLALGNDTTLIYGQLAVSDLKEGDIVEAGECLGTVAEPTRYYVVEGPNLYFQVKEGNDSVNPESLLNTDSE